MSLQEAARMNSAGAAFLASGDASNAVKAFRKALVVMETIIAAGDAESKLDGGCQPGCSSVIVPNLEHSFYIYNRAIVFEAPSEEADADLTFLNVIILFNLAQTFLQRARTCGQEGKLRKALQLYDLCCKLVPDVATSAGSLVLAALNNSAIIYYELQDYDQVADLLDAVRVVAEHVPVPVQEEATTKMTTTTATPFTQGHFDEFFLNVAITKPPTTAASA